MAADYWALGILIFEFLTGNPPFNSADAMRTYRMALRGIDAIDMPVGMNYGITKCRVRHQSLTEYRFVDLSFGFDRC